MTFQSFNLFENLNVLENTIYLPKQLYSTRHSKLKIAKRISKSWHGRGTLPWQAKPKRSGGQKQRVAIARALSMNPDATFSSTDQHLLLTLKWLEVLKIMQDLAQGRLDMICRNPRNGVRS